MRPYKFCYEKVMLQQSIHFRFLPKFWGYISDVISLFLKGNFTGMPNLRLWLESFEIYYQGNLFSSHLRICKFSLK